FQQWLIRSPEVYDVAVTSSVFGDIATDLAAVLQGGMGMAAGGNIGDEHAMFEPIHGSAPKHAGKDEVNPTAMILAVKMMLDWLGRRKGEKALREAETAVEQAVECTLKKGTILTYDRSDERSVGHDVSRLFFLSIGDEHAMFEPIHGSAPKHAGKDEVNPTAMILAVQMMLDWLGRRKGEKALREAATAVEQAVESTLKKGTILTYDLGGTAKGRERGR